MALTMYTYDCGCQMGRVKAEEINDVKINCDHHRNLLRREIRDLAAKLSALLRQDKLNNLRKEGE